MASDKVPTLPLIFQNKSPKKVSKAKKRLSAIDLLKMNALKALEQSDSSSERDCVPNDKKPKNLPSGGNVQEKDKQKESRVLPKNAKQISRRNNTKQSTKAVYGSKATRIGRNKMKTNNRMRLPERNIQYLENRIDRRPNQTTDCIMEVVTMVSEVTISDIERDSKNKTRRKDRLPPELSSPDLRRPSSAFRRKSNKTIQKKAYNKTEKTKDEIKDRPLVDLQRYLQKMADCSQNTIGRPITKPRLYIGRDITRKSEIGKKSLLAGLRTHQETKFDHSGLFNQRSSISETGVDLYQKQLTYNENAVLSKSTLKTQQSSAPDIKIIPPGEECQKCFVDEDESSPNCLSILLDRYPSEIPSSAKETWNTYIKLQRQGFPVALKTLQRGLMTPTDQRILKELFNQVQTRKGFR